MSNQFLQHEQVLNNFRCYCKAILLYNFERKQIK